MHSVNGTLRSGLVHSGLQISIKGKPCGHSGSRNGARCQLLLKRALGRHSPAHVASVEVGQESCKAPIFFCVCWRHATNADKIKMYYAPGAMDCGLDREQYNVKKSSNNLIFMWGIGARLGSMVFLVG